MNQPHYLRFARALAFAAVAGCGARTESEERYGLDATPDTSADAPSFDTNATHDTSVAIGACRNFGTSAVVCAAGGTCVLSSGSVAPECRHDVIGAAPCGVISCSSDCYCSPTTPNACDCARAVEGPLSPPDLASA